MKSFKDNAGRIWTVAVNTNTIKRVRALVEIDLMQIVEDAKLTQRLMDDPIVLVDVLYAVCKPEADLASVSDVQFGEAMAGDAIDLATAVFLEEVAYFFPSARRTVLKRALSRMQVARVMAVSRAVSQIDAIDFEALLEAGNSSGSSPAPSASTPAN